MVIDATVGEATVAVNLGDSAEDMTAFKGNCDERARSSIVVLRGITDQSCWLDERHHMK